MRIRNLNQPSKSSVSLSLLTPVIGVQPLQDIDEVNMFKDDNTVIHFKKPSSKFAPTTYLAFQIFKLLILFSPILRQRELDGGDRKP